MDLAALIQALSDTLGAEHPLVAHLSNVASGDDPFGALSDDELAVVEAGLVDVVTDDRNVLNLAALQQIRDVAHAVRGEATGRGEAREQLLGEILDEGPGGEPRPTDSPPAAPTEPIAAGAGATPQRPPLSRVADRVPARQRYRATSAGAGRIVTEDGRELDGGLREIAQTVAHRWSARRSAHKGGTLLDRAVQIVDEFPEDRRLTDNPQQNFALIAAVTGPPALLASGGLCAPLTPRYSQEVIATGARPVRDGVPGFQATRGGIVFLPPPVLADVTDGVSIWTELNDRDPGSDGPETKPFVEFTCPDHQEARVDAVVRRARFGNFQPQFFGERVDALLETLMAAHARVAEARMLAQMVAASTAVTTVQQLGATRDLLTAIDRATAAYRSAARMSDRAMLRVALPAWARNALRADIARSLPGGPRDTLSVSDAQIGEWFAVRSVSPIYSLDWQPFATPAAGPLAEFPTTLQWLVYPEGAFLHLDGGTLDLGVVRDSTLNDTNDAEFFAETFERTVRVGHQALAVTSDVCVSGAVAGTTDPDGLCAS